MIERKSIFKSIFEKPWEESQILKDNNHDGKALSMSGSKLGVRYMMLVSTVIFSLFIVSYSDRMLVHDWKNMPEPWLLWLNTLVLLINSYVFHKTKVFAYENEYTKTKKGLFISGLLSYSFLIGQAIVWYLLMKNGYYADANPANAFFYLFTALHGLHLMGGLIFWGRTTSKLLKSDNKLENLQHSIELCAVYWHFLLIIWLVLFGLMLFT